MIKDKVLYWTERMVRNTVDKDTRRRKQLLGLFPPLMVKMHPMPNYPSGHPGNFKQWAESIESIPAPMFANGINFDYVGSADGTTPFVEGANPAIARFGESDKYTSNLPRYSYIGGKLQVYRFPDLSLIRADYIPANFREYAIFNAAMCNTVCTWDDDEYPLPGDILQLVMQSVAAEIAHPALPMNHDREEIKVAPGK